MRPQKRAAPTRTCVGCRRKGEPSSFLRLTVSPDGVVVVDHPPRLGGRGAWICPSPQCLARASRRGGLQRCFDQPVVVPSGSALVAEMVDRVTRRVDGLLAAAGKARKVATGADEARVVARDGKASLVVVARDASPRVRETLAGVCRGAALDVMEFGDRARLGRALAREEVAAVALMDAGFGAAVGRELTLLRQLDAAGAEKADPFPPRREGQAVEGAT